MGLRHGLSRLAVDHQPKRETSRHKTHWCALHVRDSSPQSGPASLLGIEHCSSGGI